MGKGAGGLGGGGDGREYGVRVGKCVGVWVSVEGVRKSVEKCVVIWRDVS